MKKYFLLICLLFFTGCSVQYNIDFVDDKISEDITFSNADSNEYNAVKKNQLAPVPSFINSVENLEEPTENEGVQYYTIKAKNNDIYLNYDFDISDFGKSYVVNNCYSYFRVFQEDDEIVFSTDKNFLCPLSSSGVEYVDIVITTNHDVLFNNADKVVDGKYIWHITEDNKDDANIQISFSKEANRSAIDKALSNYTIRVIVIVGFLVVLGAVFGIIISIRYKRVNKI